MIIDERDQQLAFEDGWVVSKWDESPLYRDHVEKVDGLKAVDVVAARGKTVVLIEMKDFRLAEDVNSALEKHSADTLVQKLVHTVGAVVAAGAAEAPHDHLRERLGSAERLLVLVLVEVPVGLEAALGPWTTKLKQRLVWMKHAEVLVANAPLEASGLRYSVG